MHNWTSISIDVNFYQNQVCLTFTSRNLIFIFFFSSEFVAGCESQLIIIASSSASGSLKNAISIIHNS